MGKAKNLKKRVSSYFLNKGGLGEKTQVLVSKIQKIRILPVTSEIESLLLEANYIKKYEPQYNIRLTDGKAYPLIKITVGDTYPAVLIARRPDDPASAYFGPYPNAGDMKLVLKTVRRIFPYQSIRNHPKKVCLYWHLGLCPCPIVFNSREMKKLYKRTIRHVITFLQGDIRKVIKELEKEKNQYIKEEKFEKAGKIQKKIEAIAQVTTSHHTPFEYDNNPNLRSDIKQSELSELSRELKRHGVPIDSLTKIECYDISNIQGHAIVGSLVVFLEGEKENSLYRRFKIRTLPKGLPNDVASMREVLRRRLKHDDWTFPSLIIVDGGKGQISSALSVLKELKLDIPLVGLAKREETIITSDFKNIRLPYNSSALHLVRRIRDEAHRFAISYHRKLRGKLTFS